MQLLFDVLWQLLVLFIPARHIMGSCWSGTFMGWDRWLNARLRHDKTHIIPRDPPIRGRVGDAGDSCLNHQLRPVVKLYPHLSTRQLRIQRHRLHISISVAIINKYWLVVTDSYLWRPSNIGHKYGLDNFSCALCQVLSHWGAFLTHAGWGEIRAVVGDHLEGN